jgi:TctA family transporter
MKELRNGKLRNEGMKEWREGKMLKRMGKKIITGLMIALMVVGIFVSIANFTAVPTFAKAKTVTKRGVWVGFLGACFTVVHVNCTVTLKK